MMGTLIGTRCRLQFLYMRSHWHSLLLSRTLAGVILLQRAITYVPIWISSSWASSWRAFSTSSFSTTLYQ
jgi:hypothetical protein